MWGIREFAASLFSGCCCLAFLTELQGAEPMGGTVPPPPAPAVSAGPMPWQHATPGPVGTPWPSTPMYGSYTTRGAGPAAGTGPFWAPGGYDARIGSPYYYHDPRGPQHVVTGDPYYDHFGPGFQRHDLHGHYRFPYYNYRAPWYYPGRAVYNRDTNLPW
jgi:hypothetical protein